MFHTTESWKISAKLGEAVVCQYVEDHGVVCPPSLRTKLFTTSAVDYGAPFSHLFAELKISPIEVHILWRAVFTFIH